MKNKTYVTFATLIVIFITSLAVFSADISGTKLRFGSATLHDSVDFITFNKNVKITGTLDMGAGGNFLFSGNDGLVWQYPTYADAFKISGLGGDMTYSATSHNFKGMGGVGAMMTIDSNTSLITNELYTKLGGSSAPAIKQVYLTGVVPAVSNVLNIAHGIADYNKIIAMDFVIRDDSLTRNLPKGYNITTGLSTGFNFYATSTNVVYITPGTAVNIPGDTIKITLTYTQ